MSDPLDKVCPQCGAEAGQPCIGARGHRRKSFHRGRASKRIAHALYSVPDEEVESPIESDLVGALRGWLDHYDFNEISLLTQHPVGPFRADIVLIDGERRLVVECDGAAYHGSPEQVERDKRRDRYCVVRGYFVMRFTGSEIKRDVRGCAAEIGLWVKSR